jgi:hypothetical protein
MVTGGKLVNKARTNTEDLMGSAINSGTSWVLLKAISSSFGKHAASVPRDGREDGSDVALRTARGLYKRTGAGGNEAQRRFVDAIAQVRRFRAVVKEMP